MASSSDKVLPPPPPRHRPPPNDANAPVPPPLSLEYLWQVRSGKDSKGPWVTLDVVTSRKLETQYAADNYESIVDQADGSSYYYDLLAWEEQRPHEEYGRPLRRVPWSLRYDETWSVLGEDHARGAFLDPASEKASPDRHHEAHAASSATSEDEEVWWQFRGGKSGYGKWRWSDDHEWLEAAYQNRATRPRVTKVYGDEEYEIDFVNMMQTNLTSAAAPKRAIRRWIASLHLTDD